MPKDKSITNLSKYLHVIHECQKDDCKINGQEIVRELFAVQGIPPYGDEKNKSIYTGHRPIIPNDIEEYTKKDKAKDFKDYFLDILDINKTQFMFAEFGIEKDEKIDFNVFCEALAMQYQNYTRYGDLANTTVKSIYEVLIDSKGYSADPNANEKAVIAAHQLLLNAIGHLAKINPVLDQISDVKEPIESFLMTITQVYSVLFARMNRVGRISYKSLREKYIRKNSRADKYIKMASEPGALPIELSRRFEVVVYDITNNHDYYIGGEAGIEEEYTKEDLIEGLEQITELKEFIELYFTEYTIYHLENEKANIVNDVYILVMITREFLKKLSVEVHVKVPQDILDNIRDRFMDAQRLSIAFAFDGSYYRPTKTVTYAATIEQIMFDSEGNGKFTGEDKFTYGPRCPAYGETFAKAIESFANYEIDLYRRLKDDPMNEIIVINADKTYRYYMFVNTSKAKAYRKIREISQTAAEDHAIAVLVQSINVVHFDNKDELMLLPAQERIESPGGIDALTIFAATWDKIKAIDFKCEELKKGNIKAWNTDTVYYLYKPFLVTLAGLKMSGYSYTSVFKDVDPVPNKKK